MRNHKKVFICMIVIALIVVLLMICDNFLNNLTVADRESIKIIASNDKQFKVIYTLHNFPDESYELKIRDKYGDEISLFAGDGAGNKHIEIKYLCSNSNFDYYKAIHKYRDVVYDELFVYNEKKAFVIEDSKKHIAKHYDSILMFNDHEGEIFEMFVPAAKHQILNDNNGDYIGAYGERLILDGNIEILEKINFFIENPDEIKYDICSKEEILLKCQELLQKYGGEH